MIERLRAVSGPLAVALPDDLELTTDELRLMDDVLMLLRPVKDLTVRIQAAKHVSLSELPLLWSSLIDQLQRMAPPPDAKDEKVVYNPANQVFHTYGRHS